MAGVPIELYWENTFENNTLVKMTENPVENSTEFELKSFEGHGKFGNQCMQVVVTIFY